MKERSFLNWYTFKNYNNFLKTYHLKSNYNSLMLFKNYYKNVYIPFLLKNDNISQKSYTIL